MSDGTSSGDGAASDAPASDAVTNDTWGATNQPACNGTVYACGDGEDDDGDGLVDNMDTECMGPCDDDEGSFATGIRATTWTARSRTAFSTATAAVAKRQMRVEHLL